MKKLIFSLLVILSLALVQGCDKEPERMEDFLAEFATVLKSSDSYRFKLDNGRILIPDEVNNFSGIDGDRVVIYWTPLNDDSVKIIRISPIFKGTIVTDGILQGYKNDPLKIQSVWVEGDYLNLVLEIEYNSVPHSVSLFRDTQSPFTDLYFAHSNNNDPPGFPQIMYASFLLSSLRDQSGSDVPFRLFINTYNGLRQFSFTLIGTGQ